MSCCNTSGFLTQAELSLIGRNHSVIFEEICMIQQALLAHVRCQTALTKELIIGGNTPMTAYNRITSLNLVSAGSGYTNFNATVSIINNIGTNAEFSLVINNQGEIVDINIDSPGINYTLPIEYNIDHPFGEDAILDFEIDINGSIILVNVIESGVNYNTLYPTLVIQGTGGTGANATFDVNDVTYGIENLQLVSGGYGYPTNTTVSIIPANVGLGSGAIITPNIYSNTFGTNTTLYYQQLEGFIDNVVIQEQMDTVVKHFVDLGYSIVPIVNDETMNTILWKISY
jgi:hypothetical protein